MTAAQWIKDHADYDGNDCLIWPFFRDPHVGRGKVGYMGKIWWAHRLMCCFAHGKPPTPKHQTRHSCGNGHLGCVNPRHLSWTTQSKNQLDRRKHGTTITNPWGNRGKLTKKQIKKIQSLKGKQAQLKTAMQFRRLKNVNYF